MWEIESCFECKSGTVSKMQNCEVSLSNHGMFINKRKDKSVEPWENWSQINDEIVRRSGSRESSGRSFRLPSFKIWFVGYNQIGNDVPRSTYGRLSSQSEFDSHFKKVSDFGCVNRDEYFDWNSIDWRYSSPDIPRNFNKSNCFACLFIHFVQYSVPKTSKSFPIRHWRVNSFWEMNMRSLHLAVASNNCQ
jgi:hypothetical protein